MNQELYDTAIYAIEELFGDTSVSKEKAKENLESLIHEIEVMIQSLKEM